MQVHAPLATYFTPQGVVLPPKPADKMWKNKRPDVSVVKKWFSEGYFECSVL